MDPENKGLTKAEINIIMETWSQIDWNIIPHRICRAEAMIKIVKRCLQYFPTTTLSLMEFDCVFKQISATINNCPLGFYITDQSLLNPNQ